MEIRGLLQNPRFIKAAIIIGMLVAVFLVFNLFVIGGDVSFDDRNSIISPLAALITSFLFVQASIVKKDKVSRRIWLGMAAGFGLYGFADIIWAYYSIVLQQTVPYPSIADGIWTIGYIPLYYALFSRYRSLKAVPDRRQRWMIAGVSLVFLFFAALFLFRPILAGLDPQRALEGFFNVFYPLGDLGLVILSCHILVLLREGRFALSWRLIVAGIFIMTLSDLLFCYATWHEMYYPQGRVNALTNLVDTTYTLAYIASASGIYLYRLVWELKETFVLRLEFAPSTRYYAFIGTDRDHKIISLSDNFYRLVNGRKDRSFYKQPLAEAFGVNHASLQAFAAQIASRGTVSNMPFLISTLDSQTREVWLSAVAIYDPEQNFNGANIALISDMVVPEELRWPRNQELVEMINYLLTQAGSRPKDESQAMRAYFLETIRLLSSMLFQFGGAQFNHALFRELEHTVQQEKLSMELNERAITIPEDYAGEALANLLIPLLQTARRYVAGMVGEQNVKDEIDDLEKHLPPAVLRDLDKYQLRTA